MKRLIISAYRCDPGGVSEAYSGFMTASTLAAQHQVLLCTPSYNLPALRRWLLEEADEAVASNLRLHGIPVPRTDGQPDGVLWGIKPGFFLYDALLTRALEHSPHTRDASLVWHRTPMSFRYRTTLHSLALPLVVGPVGGGLKPPAELADFFLGEPKIHRLRALDGILLASRWWTRPLDKARVVLITCDYVRTILPERLIEKCVSVSETGIEAPSITRPTIRESGPLTVLFVGRLARYKAPTMAIEAFARLATVLKREGRETRFVLVGDGPEMAACIRLAARLGVSEQVTFAGQVDREDALAWYASADIFLFPSVTEATGNVYLEAMRAGLPLVVCANGGGSDLPPDAAAMKIPVGSPTQMVQGFAAALQELASSPRLRYEMGAAGLQSIVRQYSWTAVSATLCEIIDRVASDPSLAPVRQ